MLDYIKNESNTTYTENGAVTYKSTMSDCLDLFASIGAVRNNTDKDIIDRFIKAFAEDKDTAMKILFFARDVRGGLGERRVFRVIIKWLAEHEPESLRKNISLIPEYGRFDDLIQLMGTSCEKEALQLIKIQLNEDMNSEKSVSLLAKWLPSVNTSSKDTVFKGKYMARCLGMSEEKYRKTLAALRRKIGIIENNLREKNYSFDYSCIPSNAMLKYRKAFIRNDQERYGDFIEQAGKGKAKIHTGVLAPYDIIAPCFNWYAVTELSEEERKAMDVTWNSLENFGNGENSLVVIDGSGSMYIGRGTLPAAVALSLGIYFAERNTGVFHNHFITFSESPQLVEIKGRDIFEKVRYCSEFNEVANTNLQKVFELILKAGVKNKAPQEEMNRSSKNGQ